MSEHDNKPTLGEIVQKLTQLAASEISRQQASDWASPWIVKYDEIQFDANYDLDRKIKKALDHLAGADAISTDRPYLYSQSDFERWLHDLTS
jgi:hypothetical protein